MLERRPNQICEPAFECSYWFLSCTYISYDQEKWLIHCLSHFRSKEPPMSVQCPLCEDFKCTYDNERTAWRYRVEHVDKGGQDAFGTST